MKTTVDIAPDLLEAAKAEARRRGSTLRELVEEGLQRVLHEDAGTDYTLPDRSVGGSGLVADLAGRPFSDVRDRAYEGRGA
jgi:hypothetical protein